MAKTVTTPRRSGTEKFYWKPQSAFGTGSIAANAGEVIFGRLQINRNPILHDPDGGGSNYERATGIKVGEAPTFEIDCALNRSNIRLLEYLFQVDATVSNAQLTEANDQGAQLASWSLAGVRPGINTEWAEAAGILGAAKLYVTLANVTTTRTVNLYSDAAKTVLVATGNRSGDGVITLAQSGNSGLSGSVTVTFTIDDTDITLTINTIDMAVSSIAAVDRYFSLGRDNTTDEDFLKDCIIKKATIRSGVAAGARLILEGVASTHATTGGNATQDTPGDLDVYVHEHVAFRRDPGGTPAEVAVDTIELSFENLLTIPYGGSQTALAYVRHGLRCDGKLEAVYANEAAAFLTQAAAQAWEDVDFKWTNSSKVLTVTLDQVQYRGVDIPEAQADRYGAVSAAFTARQAAGASPAAPIAITWQP